MAVLAWDQTGLIVPWLDGPVSWRLFDGWPAVSHDERVLMGIAAGAGAAVWIMARFLPGPMLRGIVVIQGALVASLLGVASYHNCVTARLAKDDWVNVQLWAQKNTRPEQLFLTPINPSLSGFRIHSERPVACEWRDGTQMYFTAGYGRTWWNRANTLRPNMAFNRQGRQVFPGISLEEMPDTEILRLARQVYKADYIVLPVSRRERSFRKIYANASWAVYEPVPEVPPDAVDREVWIAQERFMKEVVLPNIEKYRKSDAKIRILDAQGEPLAGADYQIQLMRHRFGFGASLPFFQPVEGNGNGRDYKPQPVTQKELDRFLEVFNYTVIPFSGKWMYIEPQRGQRHYAELDRYVDWCTQHNIEMEFHFLSGLAPEWVQELIRQKKTSELETVFRRHALEMIVRYGDRIRTWQVVNDRHLIQYAAPVIAEIRKLNPQLRLGISDCTKFAIVSPRASREMDIYRGLSDVQALAGQNARLDFFSAHGHAPHGLWPDVRQMYDTFDAFAKAGVKVHVTEEVVPLTRIVGPVRNGTWTPELQAEFIERYFMVCFSHPAVEACNYWVLGPDAITDGSGLLDEKYEPTPAFRRLKELIRNRWSTHLSGKLANHGTIGFRGFQGSYQITVALPSGKTLQGTFAVQPDAENTITLRINDERGVLERP